ncbi:Uncharacterized protein BP5553_09442 [Venustampulla echinocandica]|uniref:Major facilitator superfamily (MFS) profile domain-containing protein n=1 Tax=Venustampulla echinocandica TaxID=2656787 RepID=A0A370TCQ2_9HELO|nr:Uncharacterized protein BP5553_09442 [Venustampulla echinocandica]RDL32040.1 Uncharacterized protein BP5553_09442 [Venustampulla echinocandica]
MSSTPGSGSVVIPQTSVLANWKCMLIACVVSTANMQYGFDSAVIGGLQAMPGFLKVFGFVDPKIKIGYGIDPTFQQLITSLLTLGAFLSSLVAGIFAGYFGRKAALWCACVVNCAGLATQIATTNKGVIYLGRILLGLSNGFLVTFSNIYTSEVAPAHLRGVMVAFFTFWVNVGSLVGSVVNYYCAKMMDKRSYVIPLALLYIVPVALAMGLLFVPESPRWLLYQGKDKEGVNLRRTILCYASMASHAASGTWFAISYGTYFLQIAGVDEPFKFAIITVMMGIIGTIAGMFAIRDWLGRRFIFIWSSVAGALAMAIIGIAGILQTKDNSHKVGKALIASGCIFCFFYNCGIGLVSYPVGTEIVSSRLRAWTLGSAISLGYFLAWLVGFCSPYFINPSKLNWGVKYGWVWTVSNLICALFFYLFLPETKGRSLEEIDELFENRVSVKDFPKYHTKIQEEAARDVQSMRRNGSSKEPVVTHVEKTEKGDDMA